MGKEYPLHAPRGWVPIGSRGNRPMIKRTLEISQTPAHLSAKLEQLTIQPFEQDKSAQRSVPAEDIGVVMVDQPRSTFSYHALSTLMRYGAAFVICGRDHLPLGLMLPMADHSQVVWRIQDQAAASKPLKKRLWQQLVQAKVAAQARNLDHAPAAARQLQRMVSEIRSGDATNVEGQAARIYWASWLEDSATTGLASSVTAGTGMVALRSAPFRRDPDGTDPLNAMLNYGYSVLRAALGRALVASGLIPALGLHHRNRSNTFCLADDLIEPLRPLVDHEVRACYQYGWRELTQGAKARLLSILTHPVVVDGQQGPLMVSLHRYVGSLVHCYQTAAKKLVIPVAAYDDDPPMTERG